MRIKNLQDVVAWRMCIGCGACEYICKENKIKLVNVVDEGIRPTISLEDCNTCNDCYNVCPGYQITHSILNDHQEYINELKQSWGPILEVWEGYAADSEIRYHGSSAGVTTGIALYCLEKGTMSGVLHIGSDPNKPWLNKTFLSQSRDELLLRTGSRYSPASPCDSLDKIESAQTPCVFIGKPCDVAGLRKAQRLKPELDRKVGLAIGIFCAGTPSTQAVLDFLKSKNINPEQVDEIRYRGKGWPGMFSVKLKGELSPSKNISYYESWGFLQAYRPFRCYLCPDTTAEFADISCGDPWYREIHDEAPGYSLVLVRTEKGRKILHEAMKNGYIILKKTNPELLEKSQKNQLLKRRAVWGRLLAMKMFALPTPQFTGFHLFNNWLKLNSIDKVRSILGTVKRIIIRKYTRPCR